MDYSRITNTLFIGTAPRSEAYQVLRDLGVRLVINMRVERRPYPDFHQPPIPVLWLPSFDSPVIPIPIRYLRRGAEAALEVIAAGGKVYVHCAQGIHRGVAIGAAILIAQGYTSQEAMELIKQRRQVADPDAWYIKRQILRFSAAWRLQPGKPFREDNQAT